MAADAGMGQAESVEFPHELRWDRLGRLGQKCRILRSVGGRSHVQFEDGTTEIMDRQALRRRADETIKPEESAR